MGQQAHGGPQTAPMVVSRGQEGQRGERLEQARARWDGGLAVLGVGVLRGVVLEGDDVLADPDAVHAAPLGLTRHRGQELRRGERIGGRQPDVEVHALLPRRRRGDPEDGVLGRDAPQLVVGRVGRDAVEESVRLRTSSGGDRPASTATLSSSPISSALNFSTRLTDDELAFARDAEVAHPLGLAPRGHQVAPVVEGEDVHGIAAPLAGLPASDPQHPRAPHAHAQARQAATVELKALSIDVGFS